MAALDETQRAAGNCAASRQGRGSRRSLCISPSDGLFLLRPPSRISLASRGKRSSKAFRRFRPGRSATMEAATPAIAQASCLAGFALSRLRIASRQSIGLCPGIAPSLANAFPQQVPGLAVDRVAQFPSHVNLIPRVCVRAYCAAKLRLSVTGALVVPVIGAPQRRDANQATPTKNRDRRLGSSGANSGRCASVAILA